MAKTLMVVKLQELEKSPTLEQIVNSVSVRDRILSHFYKAIAPLHCTCQLSAEPIEARLVKTSRANSDPPWRKKVAFALQSAARK
jgi:hypothetical protein